MEDYKPNSHKSREVQTDLIPARKVEKVVTGSVKTKKKTGVQKFADVFIAEDIASVKSYIFAEVLIPAIKTGIWDVFTNGLGMALGIDAGALKKKSPMASKISYRSYYEDKNNDRRDERRNQNRSRYDYDDIIFDNRGDAEMVLDQMEDMISRFGVVSIADMYDMAELDCPHTFNKYGWTDLRVAKVDPVRGGYIIRLPRAMPID